MDNENNWGGKREGSGRKKAELKSTQIYARVTENEKKRILEYAKTLGMNCSDFIKTCIEFYGKSH